MRRWIIILLAVAMGVFTFPSSAQSGSAERSELVLQTSDTPKIPGDVDPVDPLPIPDQEAPGVDPVDPLPVPEIPDGFDPVDPLPVPDPFVYDPVPLESPGN